MKSNRLLLLLFPVVVSGFKVAGCSAKHIQHAFHINTESERHSVSPTQRKLTSSQSSLNGFGSNPSLSTKTALRGGAIALPTTAVAKGGSAFFALNGIALFFVPNKLLRDVYNIEPDNGRPGMVAAAVMRTIASVGTGVACTVYLSMVKNASAQLSIGYCLLPRVLVFWSFLLTGGLEKLRMSKGFFVFNCVLSTWVTISNLFNLGNPTLSARVFSSMAIFKGACFAFAPAKACSRLLGVSVDGEEMAKSRALLRGMGNELLTSAVLMASLAFGMDPAMAAGCVSLLWTGLLFNMGFIDKTWRLMESDGPRAQVVHIIISTFLACGFFFGSS